MPKVSIIIPVYNREKYLRKCLDSVVSQTLKDIEIICVNDCSTDNSLSILKEFANNDSRIKIIDLKKNMKPGGARNRGMEIVSSDYIMFVDSDDYIVPECCETLYKNMTDFNTDLVVSCVNNYSDNHSENLDKQTKNMQKIAEKCTLPEGLYKYSFLTGKTLRTGPCAKLYKTDIIKKYNIRFPEHLIQEDEAFYRLYMYRVKTIYSNTKKVYNRLIHEDSIMYKKKYNNKSSLDILNVYDFIYEYAVKNNFYNEYKDKLRNDFYSACGNIEKNNNLTQKELIEYNRTKHRLEYKFGFKNPLENIFSLKNSGIHKIITILGLKMKFKSKKLIQRKYEEELNNRLKKISLKLKKLDADNKELNIKLKNQKINMEYNLCKYMSEDKYAEYLQDWYYMKTGEILNLQDPETYNEKIQWMKLYDSTPIKTQLSDKYLVREYVKQKAGEEYLIPLLGVWDCYNDINFNELPDKFILKCNHGCGYNIIVKDKSKLNPENVQNTLNNWLSENFAFRAGLELHYANIQRKIIAEQYFENDKDDLYDYKFWCFDGKVKYIQFLSERNTQGLKMAFYDTDWNKQDFVYSYPMDKKIIEKPDNLSEMISVAEKLAQGFNHVRVDLYRLNSGKIYFGEMTFTSCSGVCKWTPKETDKEMGKLIKLPFEKNEQPLSEEIYAG